MYERVYIRMCIYNIYGRSVCGTRSQLTDVYTQTQRRSEVIGMNAAKLCSNVKQQERKKLVKKICTQNSCADI